MDDKGIVLKQSDGTYLDRMSWTKISQADLKDLDQNNPKAGQYVEPFIEQTQDDKKQRTEIVVKDVPRLGHPTGHSLVGALFTSTTGLFTLLMLYAANIYAGYEVSVFRAHPVGLVCGVSAVVPLIGPIVFLSMPSKVKARPLDWATTGTEQQLESNVAAAIAAEEGVPAQPAAAAHDDHGVPTDVVEDAPTPAPPPAAKLPPTKTYLRGQYTFNRRFFETQLPAFFAMSRPEAEKDKVLTFKSNRGIYIAQRISRISANDLQLQVKKGPASEEVTIPFVEIQEVQLKHKDA